MGLFEKKSTFRKFIDSITNAIYDNPDLGPEFMEELEEGLVMSDIGIDTSDAIMKELDTAINERYIIKEKQIKKELSGIIEGLMDKGERNRMSEQYPLIILMIGINGGGKTTSIAKLAHMYKKKGKSVMLAAADTFRAAAAEQLQTWGDRVGVRVIRHAEGTDPTAVIYDAIQSAKANNIDVLICDTAGRLHNKVGLMNELKKIKDVMKKVLPQAPDEVMLVLDGSTGQNAFEQAKQFSAVTSISSLAITKLDGTAKGGVVIGISDQLKVPVKYIGLGEGMEDLQLFNKREFVDSLFKGE